MNILDKYNLNSNQLEAAKHIEGPALVLAGAGSGKTRILTLRILNLVKSKMAGSDEILALTFTNKAADEIKERLNNMLGTEDIFSWMGTFHSISYKILRIFVQELSPDYKRGFTIYDSNDQTKLLNESANNFIKSQLMEEIRILNPKLDRKLRQKDMSRWLMPFGFIAGIAFSNMTNLSTFSFLGLNNIGETLIGGLLGMGSGYLGSVVSSASINLNLSLIHI